MAKKRDPAKRPAERRPNMGGSNLLWSLIAAGVAGLFAMSLIGVTPEIELSYSDLERLIQASGKQASGKQASGPAQAGDHVDEDAVEWVEISHPGTDGRQTARYGDLRDVVIGSFQVSGTVREHSSAVAAKPRTEPASGPQATKPVGAADGRGTVRLTTPSVLDAHPLVASYKLAKNYSAFYVDLVGQSSAAADATVGDSPHSATSPGRWVTRKAMWKPQVKNPACRHR
jgi:hypothetical protein